MVPDVSPLMVSLALSYPFHAGVWAAPVYAGLPFCVGMVSMIARPMVQGIVLVSVLPSAQR